MPSSIQIAGVGLACLVLAGLVGVFIFDFGITKGSLDDFFAGFGTIQTFTLTQNFQNMKCDQFNEIWIASGGSQYQVASFSERDTVFIDSQFQNQLSLSANGKSVDSVYVKLFLECAGNAMDGSTVVSGQVKLRERIGSSPEVFFIGTDRPISVFGVKTLSPTSIQDGIKKEVFSYEITVAQVDSALSSVSSSSQHFKSEMLPILNFQFNHPTVGLFSGSFDAEQFGSPVVTQFSFQFTQDIVTAQAPVVSDPLPLDPNADTDNDSIIDTNDVCPTLPETVNGYLDSDGCPDTLPDTDGDGIIDSNDGCPTEPENFNGIADSDGCPDTSVSPLDTDGDGIEDLFDGCIDAREVFNGFEDGDGCPDEVPIQSQASDTDGDGIIDTLDLCPTEPETDNGVNDGDGCPDEAVDLTLGSEVSVGDGLGSTVVIPFNNARNDADPTGIIIIVIVFAGFIGAVIALNHLKKK